MSRPAATEPLEIEAGGRTIRVSNPGRVLWPEAGFTKRGMIDYYVAVAPALLPQLRDRPITLGRWPEGVDRPGWLQAECRGRPEWLPVHAIEGRGGRTFRYCLVNDLASLLFVANLGTIELHPFLWQVAIVEPTALVFDLDPGPPASVVAAADVALRIRDLLPDGLAVYPKTSGGFGLHLVVPLEPGHTFEQTKAFARATAGTLARAHPALVVESSSRGARAGRVFVDWIQNDASRQTVAAYSLRAMAWPTASVPVEWPEVEAAARTGDARRLRFDAADAVARLRSNGDLMAGAAERAGRLPAPPPLIAG